ncbi:hypothetical protein [Chryseobacterium phocaeense]|uniref:hypothetical protein n=1 Tax=Chryseobacterium phocaeense TaxID=1816690 RepID=UPI0009BB6A6A|nr:hypothetical protein [Chryseobacterium phocaeense]
MTKFDTPAYQAEKDFKNDPDLKSQIENAWSNYVQYCTINSQMGNPWSSSYDHPRSWYYNPLVTPAEPVKNNTVPIQWGAFPNRINHYFTSLFVEKFGKTDAPDKLHELADIGPDAFSKKYNITLVVSKNPCDPANTETKPFGPSGPRGWQDEYCEWAVTRDASGDIIAVDFTHENPEYWFHMWKVSPDMVVSLYQEILNNPDVKKEDLYLLDEKGNYVIVRETGLPAYNPINKWNSGSSATAEGGGAVHLTSPPNSLGAEIYLGAAATILRVNSKGKVITDANELICAAQYGQIYRNSDPRIGQNVNSLVYNNKLKISLTNPIALYGQLPDFTQFKMPDSAEGYKINDCYKVIRGSDTNPGTTFYPFNMILHSRFEAPAGAKFKLSDIMVKGSKIKWGSQIADVFKVQLAGTGIPGGGDQPQQYPAVGDPEVTLPSVQYVLDNNLLQASLYNKLNTFSNLTSCITQVEAGTTTSGIAILASDANKGTGFDFGPGISVSVTDFQDLGNDNQLFIVDINVHSAALLGEKPLALFNNTTDPRYSIAGVLEVVASGSLPKLNIAPNHSLLSDQQMKQVQKMLK